MTKMAWGKYPEVNTWGRVQYLPQALFIWVWLLAKRRFRRTCWHSSARTRRWDAVATASGERTRETRSVRPRSESGFERPVSFWGWPPGVALGGGFHGKIFEGFLCSLLILKLGLWGKSMSWKYRCMVPVPRHVEFEDRTSLKESFSFKNCCVWLALCVLLTSMFQDTRSRQPEN